MIYALIQVRRPKYWTKNLFILAALLSSQNQGKAIYKHSGNLSILS